MVNFDTTEKYMACFVNDNEPPSKRIPLNYFSCYDSCGKITFGRLYKYVYVYDVPNSDHTVEYSLYNWEAVKVKKGCEAAVKQLIECKDGIVAMLEKNDG
jgi:hypothetical protein